MAKAKPRQIEESSQIYPGANLARVRAVRQTPKGIQLTDQLLRSIRAELTGIATDDLREK